jgi:hypothetical protein
MKLRLEIAALATKGALDHVDGQSLALKASPFAQFQPTVHALILTLTLLTSSYPRAQSMQTCPRPSRMDESPSKFRAQDAQSPASHSCE